jgi:hypothetical protein
VRAGLEGDRNLSTRLPRCFCVGVVSPGRWGVKVPRVASRSLRVRGRVQVLVAWAGPRVRGVEGEAFRGAQHQERIGRRHGATRGDANGLAGGSRLRSGRSWRNGAVLRLGPRGTGKRASARGKGAHSRRGSQATASRARESMKLAATRSWKQRSGTSVTNRTGACGPERGARLLRGEDSEGKGNPRNGCGMK